MSPHTVQKILFVDDDRYFARLYREALEKEFEVVVCYDAKAAIDAFKTETDLVAAVVDVMMPPPADFKDECHDGNTTGVWIIGQVQQEIIKRRIAIILFTNLGLKYLREEVASLNFPQNLVSTHSKGSVRSDDLPFVVQAAIAKR